MPSRRRVAQDGSEPSLYSMTPYVSTTGNAAPNIPEITFTTGAPTARITEA